MLRRLRQGADRPQARPNTYLDIDHNLCHSCGACVAVCPPDCLFLAGLALTVDQDACTACNRCVAICPVQALALVSADKVRAVP
jgi:ferredoxin